MRFFAFSIIVLCMTACIDPSVMVSTQTATISEVQGDKTKIISTTISTPEMTTTQSPKTERSWFVQISNDPTILNRTYAQVSADGMAVYSNLEDAVSQAEDHFHAPSVPAYVAYDEIKTVSGADYVHLTDGGWMLKSDLLPVQVTAFSGIELMEDFPQTFGWVLMDSNGIDLATGRSTSTKFIRYEIIEITDIQQKGGKDFVRIASSGEWLPKNIVSMVEISNEEPKGNMNCRWVDVNLAEQNLVVYDNCGAVFATLMSSAKSPAITPEGTFTIFYREVLLPLFSNDNVVAEPFYLQDVPWLLFFHENWAIHGTYWHNHFGEPWSHGCINVSPYDAHWLYQWAKDGDMIWIHR